MARVTIKDLEEQLKDLEQQLKKQNDINYSLNKEINTMQERADNSFLNSALHKQLLRENRTLKATVESKERIIRHLEEERENNKNVQKIKNERGAGRKAKVNDDIISTVTMLRLQNKSIRAISKEIGLSVGTVQKIINEHIKEEE